MNNFGKNTMLNFDDAFEIVMSSARRLGAERVGIENALNRILAEDVISDIDLPPFNKSAMDGFACRRVDLTNKLTVIETIAAGLPPKKTIGQNQCAKIMTGAVVPAGADCVIMVEYTEKVGRNKNRFTADETDDNICLKGEDVKKEMLFFGQVAKLLLNTLQCWQLWAVLNSWYRCSRRLVS